MNQPKYLPVNIRVLPALRAEVQAAAKRDGISIREWIEQAIRETLERSR